MKLLELAFYIVKKVKCSPNFMRWSMKWSLVIQDGNHLVATNRFTCGKKTQLVATRWSFTVQGRNDLVATKWSLVVQCWNNLVATRSPSGKKNDLVATRWFHNDLMVARSPEMTWWPWVGFKMTWWLLGLKVKKNNLVAIKSPNEKKMT
jgi:hypothetical protein